MGDAFGAAVVTDGVDVFNVAHPGRSATAHQRSALRARGYRCEVPGCGARSGLEIDHIDDWAFTKATRLSSFCWLCRGHHQDKTHRGWRLLGSPGSRRWVVLAEAERPPPDEAVPAEGAKPGDESGKLSALPRDAPAGRGRLKPEVALGRTARWPDASVMERCAGAAQRKRPRTTPNRGSPASGRYPGSSAIPGAPSRSWPRRSRRSGPTPPPGCGAVRPGACGCAPRRSWPTPPRSW